MTRARQLLTAAWSVLGIVAVLVVPPVALVRLVGSPLPTSVPGMSQIVEGLTERLDIGPVVKALALVCWGAWMLLSWAVMVELIATRTGRRPRHRRALAPFQAVAARLVTGLVVALPIPLSVVALPLAASAAPITITQTLPDPVSPATQSTGPVVEATIAPAGGVVMLEVQDRDNLFDLAALHLGDPMRWREIWQLNQGKMMPDGQEFTRPEFIRPGWILALPLTASVPPQPTIVAAVEVHARPLMAVAADVVALPASSVDPACIVMPASLLPPPIAPSAFAIAPGSSSLDPIIVGTLLGASGTSMLAFGIGATVRRRRQKRLASMRPDHQFAPVRARALQTEVELSAVGTHRYERVVAVLRAYGLAVVQAEVLFDSAAPPGGQRPSAVVAHQDGTVELVFETMVGDAPAGFVAASPNRLVFPAQNELQATDSAATPCPALVCVGTMIGPGGIGEVLVDLEAIGTLIVRGDASRRVAILRSLAAQLAVQPFGDVELVTVGLDLEALAGVGRGVRATLSEVPPGFTRGTSSLFNARLLHCDEKWDVAVVVACGQPCAQPGATGALVTDMAVDWPHWTLEEVGDVWVLAPLGFSIAAAGLEPSGLAALCELVASASQAPQIRQAPEPASDFVEQDWVLAVRLLGPVDVVDATGRSAEFERSKALELVAWLSQHRQVPLRNAARSALWASDVRDATFANVVSDARRSLARLAPSDDEWIARHHPDRIPLHHGVTSDAELLDARFEASRTLDDAAAVKILAPGIALIRGLPFSGTDYLWSDGEALPAAMVHLCTSAAGALAERCLALGQADDALCAAAIGLRVLPAHEYLIALRLEAHAAAGNIRELNAEFAAYERAVLNDAWGDGEMSCMVVEKRRQLLAGQR